MAMKSYLPMPVPFILYPFINQLLMLLFVSSETVHAILACNAGTEISCMENLDNISGMNDVPILRHLIFQR